MNIRVTKEDPRANALARAYLNKTPFQHDGQNWSVISYKAFEGGFEFELIPTYQRQ